MMNWRDKLVERIHRWLRLEPYTYSRSFSIREGSSFETEILCHRLWYRGNGDELRQFYRMHTGGVCDDAGVSRFWAAVPPGSGIRKIHSGLPGNMVDTLAALVLSDYDGLTIRENDRWTELARSCDLTTVLDTAIRETLVTGDGAFQITWDAQCDPHPTVRFVPADRVEYHTHAGRLTGISFFSDYCTGKARFQLEEQYTRGQITYILRDSDGKAVPLDTVPQLRSLKPVTLPDNLLAAVPLRFFASTRWPGRGKSIFANKTDVFDAHDEVISQWMDAIRCGRVMKYIPADLIPRHPETGQPLPVNSFGSNFVKIAGSADEEAAHRIDTIQPEIRYEAFLSSYTATLDMCLQGVLSPATLGIHISAEASGESQRQRKDITGFTRNTITGVLETVIPQLATLLLRIDDWLGGRSIGVYTPSVSFGEYAAPDFGTRVKTVSEAANAGILSIRAQVEQLWGGSKDDRWIEEEVNRIREEQGMTPLTADVVQEDLP